MQTKHQLYALGLAALGLVTTGSGAFAATGSASALSSAGATAEAPGNNSITRLDIATTQDGTRITIEAASPFTPDVHAWDHPNATVITVPGVWNEGRTGTTDLRKNGVYNVRTAVAPDTNKQQVRIVANTSARLTWSVQGTPDKKHWEITIWKPGAGPQGGSATTASALFAGSSDPAADGNKLRSLMDHHSGSTSAASTPANQVASAAGNGEHPLVIPAVYLRKSAPEPVTTGVRAGTLPPLRQAGLASPETLPRVTTPSAASVTTEAVVPPVAAPAPSSAPAPAKTASSEPLHTIPLAHYDQRTSTGVTAKATPTRRPGVTQRNMMAAPASPVATAVDPTFTSGEASPTARRVSLDFIGADIGEVLKALAVQSGINVILATNGGAASGAIQDKITVSLHHVSFAEALDTVVNLSGYRYARIGNTYAVGTPEAVAALARGASVGIQTTASIPFIFSDGNSLIASIISAYPTLRGRVTLVAIGSEGRQGASLATAGGGNPNDAAAAAAAAQNGNPAAGTTPPGAATEGISRVIPKGGVINVSGAPAEIDAVRSFIEATERALIEAPYAEQEAASKRFAGLQTEVYQIKYTAAPELVQILARLVPNVYVTPGPTQAFHPNTTGQSLSYSAQPIIGPGGGVIPGSAAAGGTGTAGGAAAASLTVTNETTTLLLTGQPDDLTRARDVLTKVDIRATQVVYEAKVVDVNSQDLLKLGITYDPSQPVYVGESVNAGPPGVSVGPPASAEAGRTLNVGGIYRTPYSILTQLQAVINNNHAKVLSNPNLTALDGQTATAFIGDQVKYVTNIQQTQQGQNVTTETATVGITLKVTGRSSPDGTITLYVHPEVSSITSFLNAGNGIQLPQISTRYVDTSVRVKDGETIAIGGLISDTDTKNLQRVPFFSDIPFFGELFKYRQNTHSKSEVVVFITSRLAKE